MTSRHASNLTVHTAGKSDQLSKLRKDNEDVLLAMVAKIITELTKLKTCDADAESIIMWSEMIISDYWHLKIDDIILCFKKALKGNFGKVSWARLSYDQISEWLNAYDIEQTGIHVDNSINESDKHKQDTKRTSDHLRKFL